MKGISNFIGIRKVEAFIITVGEGDGTDLSPYQEVEYLILNDGDTVVKLTPPSKEIKKC